jgi:hypothetical protein
MAASFQRAVKDVLMKLDWKNRLSSHALSPSGIGNPALETGAKIQWFTRCARGGKLSIGFLAPDPSRE